MASRHPDSLFLEKYRLETFSTNWKMPKTFKYCTPENFARAGFFNSSTKESPDAAKCFCCRKELDGWEKNDNPWVEHVKRGSSCLYVKMMKKNPKGDFKVEEIIKLFYEMKRNVLIESATNNKEILLNEKVAFKALLNNLKRLNL